MAELPFASDLLFSELRRANLARLPSYRNKKGHLCHPPAPGLPPGHNWALSAWCNATAGELGEAANLIKKIERGDFTLEEVKEELADELCDVQTYLDLLAYRAGIDLAAAILKKWNEVSTRVGSEARLHPAVAAPLPPEAAPALPPAPEWVSMTDRTPEREGWYLTWFDPGWGGGQGSSHMMKWIPSEEGWFSPGNGRKELHITHWAPRPVGPGLHAETTK